LPRPRLVEAARLDLPLRAQQALAQDQEPGRASRKARGGGRLGFPTLDKIKNGEAYNMTNLLEQAINWDDGDRAAKIIQKALGIESDDLVN
jgi:hypothetical protein